MRLRLTPPQTFTILSLIFVVSMVVATAFTQSPFFRQAIINREGEVIRDLVNADFAEQELSGTDMENYTDAVAKQHFYLSFKHLKNVAGLVRIKVFNRDKIIVWSDEPNLIGKKITANDKDLTMALDGEVRAVFSDPERASRYRRVEKLPQASLIEFYVPFSLPKLGTANDTVSGVLALYRSPHELNATIRHGLYLLWMVTVTGGIILFFFLYKLFNSVYRRQRQAESQFAELSASSARMIQVEKLSAMGQMMSEIAHQLNNPLVGVINLTQLAEREADNPQRVIELLGEVRAAGELCRGFVQRMLGFTRFSHYEPQLIELHELVRGTIVFFQQSMANSCSVKLEESLSHQTMLEIDPVLMRHALFNILHNAAQADAGGAVTVAIAYDEREGASGYHVAVSDNGPGINPDVADKIFTPFFSTKPHGTGLGLSVAQYIVLLHKGSISAENVPGGGARFIIWLPTQQRPTHEIENPAR